MIPHGNLLITVFVFLVIGIIVINIIRSNRTRKVCYKQIEKVKEQQNIRAFSFEGYCKLQPFDTNGHYVVINKEKEKIVVYLLNKMKLKFLNSNKVTILQRNMCIPTMYTYLLQEGTDSYYDYYIIVVPKDSIIETEKKQEKVLVF